MPCFLKTSFLHYRLQLLLTSLETVEEATSHDTLGRLDVRRDEDEQSADDSERVVEEDAVLTAVLLGHVLGREGADRTADDKQRRGDCPEKRVRMLHLIRLCLPGRCNDCSNLAHQRRILLRLIGKLVDDFMHRVEFLQLSLSDAWSGLGRNVVQNHEVGKVDDRLNRIGCAVRCFWLVVSFGVSFPSGLCG